MASTRPSMASTRPLVVWHGGNLTVHKSYRRLFLRPGDGSTYGYGIYGSTDRSAAYTYQPVMIKIIDRLGVFRPIDSPKVGNKPWMIAPVAGLELKVLQISGPGYVVGGPVGRTTTVVAETTRVIPGDPKSFVGAKLTCRQARQVCRFLRPAKPNPITFLIGKVIGLALLVTGLCRQDYPRVWLGWFLLGTGIPLRVPRHILAAGLGEDVNVLYEKSTKDGFAVRVIRPSAYSQLFWMVGGFTALYKDGEFVFGKDRYDFHPQLGQGVVAQAGRMTWAYSEGVSDLESLFFRILAPVVGRKYIKRVEAATQGGRKYLPSNNLWNRLGGRPFTSHMSLRKGRLGEFQKMFTALTEGGDNEIR